MSYPNFKNKHLEEALFHPNDFLRYKKINHKKFPKKYIITYQSSALNHFKKKYRGKYEKLKFNKNHDILKVGDVGFIKMNGIGSPHAVAFFEELISLGGKEFFNIGTAGGLQHEGIFVCNKAIRDEGTSHHYLSPGKYSYPDKELTKRFMNVLKKNKIFFEVGTTWTIDSPYRETKSEIHKYKHEGVVTVEMEASALFAVAKFRKVKIASAFVVSDILGETWEPKFDHINVKSALNHIIDSVIKSF